MSRKPWLAYAAAVGLLIVGLALLAVALTGRASAPVPTAVPPTPTPEPLVPTPTPAVAALAAGASATSPTGVGEAPPLPPPTGVLPASPSPVRPTPFLAATPQPVASPIDVLWQGRTRWCAAGASGDLRRFDIAPLRLGWYLDWRARADSPTSGDLEYAQMVRLRDGALIPDVQTLADIARRHPGALWLIGNEPDVKWQDNVAPAEYARLYHEAYTALKRADGRAQVAIGGITQPTPLRLRYLDAVLAAYREQFGAAMPVDVWNVHDFILREERGSWGVDIPPGLSDDRGQLYEISDNADLAAFKAQIFAFRRWMAERGLQNYPLIVSEYGIPMPEDYGFPPQVVAAFLTATFDFFLTAADPTVGYPADAHRLVQRWCWYSLADTLYPTGNLFDPQTGAITPLGRAWVAYVQGR